MKNSPLTYEELKDYRILIGQLGWVAGQRRKDLSFDVCDLSSKVKHATVNDLLRANKVLKKAKSECVTLCFGDFEKLENCKIVAYNDSSFGNLADGGSQGGFVIYLVNECGQASPIMLQSRKYEG